MLSIGELARRTGVSRRTIRYYEELGILPKPPRSPGGTRKYPPDYRFYVEGALALREVGFSLDEIKLLGRLALGRPLLPSQRAKAVAAIREKLRTLEHKIRLLNRIHDILEEQERAHDAPGDGPRRIAELIKTEKRPGQTGAAP